MAARGEAQADVEVSTLVVPAWRLRWRAPELALVLGERAVALASTRRDEVDRLRAEALVVFASNRMGRGVRIADRALDALKAAEAASEQETAWRLRVELADSARSVGAPLTGFAAVRPVLEADDVPPGLRATALVQASECLVSVGRGAALAQALDEADRLYQADPLLDHDTTLLHRGLLRASAAGQHRRWGDLRAAVAAARDGLGLLDRLKEAEADNGQVRGRLTVELVCALLDLNKPGEASEVGTPLLERPVRAPSASTTGWLRLALATRVHLPAGRVDQARDLLRDAADSAERHQLDTLLAESLLALAHVHEVAGDLVEALANLRSAHAAERRRARAVYAVRARLAAEFAGVHRRPVGGLHDELAALLRTATPPVAPPTDPGLAPEVKQQLRQWRPVQMHRSEGIRVKRSRRAAEDMTVEGLSAARAHAADRWRLVQPFGETENAPAPGGRRRAPEPETTPPPFTQGRPEHARSGQARPPDPTPAAATPEPDNDTHAAAAASIAEGFPPPPAATPTGTAGTAGTTPGGAPHGSPATAADSTPAGPAAGDAVPADARPGPVDAHAGGSGVAGSGGGPQQGAAVSAVEPVGGVVADGSGRAAGSPAGGVGTGGVVVGGAQPVSGAPDRGRVGGQPGIGTTGAGLGVGGFGIVQRDIGAAGVGEPGVPEAGDRTVPEVPERSVPAAGLIAAAGAVRSGRRRAAREAAEGEGERSSGDQGADASVLDTLKAAGLLDPQRAGGRRRAPDADEDTTPEPVQHDPVEHSPAQHDPAQHDPAQHDPVQQILAQQNSAQQNPVQENTRQENPVQEDPVQDHPLQEDPVQDDTVQRNEHEPVQWRVEPPPRLRSEEPPPVDMFDSPTMVQPVVRDDVPPVGLGAAFVKGPVIPTARVPEPPDYPLPSVPEQPAEVRERPVFPPADVDAPEDETTPEPDQVPGVPEPDQVPPVPIPDPVPSGPSPETAPAPPPQSSRFGPTGFLSAADVEHDDAPPTDQAPTPTAAGEEPKEPFVTAVVVGGKTIDLPPLVVEPTPPALDSPSATRASRRHKSDLSLAELLAEALVAYEDARREDEAAGRVDEDTVPISPVGSTPPESDNETTAPIQRVDPAARFDTWTLPEA
ncbi:hypothetical protein GCM10027184_22670 [Saccharothrix stipae]